MRIFRAQPAANCGTVLAELDNGGPYRRPRPTVRGPRPDHLFRHLLRHMFEQVDPPPAQVVLFRDATVRGPGVITLPGDIVVEESLINTHHLGKLGEMRRLGPDRFTPLPDFPDGRPMPPGQHVLLKQEWDTNYGHWLVEGLPRVALLQGLVEIAACRFALSIPRGNPATEAIYAAMHDGLALFGVQPGQLDHTGHDACFYPELIYPLPLTRQPWVKAPLVVHVLEALARHSLVAATAAASPRRIFIRRPRTGRRPLENQDEVEALLAGRGFTALVPGELTLYQQIKAFSHATHVVGTLGAECTNLVFAPRGVRLLGLAPPELLDDFFYDLVGLKDGAYFCLHGPAAEGSAGMNAPFTVDLALLGAMLTEFE